MSGGENLSNFKTIIPQLIDATALFGHVCNISEKSYKRKEAIKPILHPDFKPVFSRTHKVGRLLFGDDLPKTVQDLRSSSKAVSQLTSQPYQGNTSFHKFKTRTPHYSNNNKSFIPEGEDTGSSQEGPATKQQEALSKELDQIKTSGSSGKRFSNFC